MWRCLCVVLALAVSGCGRPADTDLKLAYGKAVRQIGVFPVYPPREEFQIGDIYMWSQSIRDPNDTVSVYLDSLPWMRQSADSFMATRIVFRNTIPAANTPANNTIDLPPGPPVLAVRGDMRDPELSASLPIAAFPTVTADAGFTAGLGLVSVLSAVGLAGGNRTYVSLNFNDVRTYWVPSVEVMANVHATIGPLLSQRESIGRVERNRLVALRKGAGTDPCANGRRCGVSVVTRVYLTRQIDYTYRNTRIVAAALRRAETEAAKAPAAPAVNVTVTTAADGSLPADIDRQIADIRKQLAELSAGDAQGQSFRFESWDARGVTFASRYQRPVVVGWDGIDLHNQ